MSSNPEDEHEIDESQNVENVVKSEMSSESERDSDEEEEWSERQQDRLRSLLQTVREMKGRADTAFGSGDREGERDTLSLYESVLNRVIQDCGDLFPTLSTPSSVSLLHNALMSPTRNRESQKLLSRIRRNASLSRLLALLARETLAVCMNIAVLSLRVRSYSQCILHSTAAISLMRDDYDVYGLGIVTTSSSTNTYNNSNNMSERETERLTATLLRAKYFKASASLQLLLLQRDRLHSLSRLEEDDMRVEIERDIGDIDELLSSSTALRQGGDGSECLSLIQRVKAFLSTAERDGNAVEAAPETVRERVEESDVSALVTPPRRPPVPPSTSTSSSASTAVIGVISKTRSKAFTQLLTVIGKLDRRIHVDQVRHIITVYIHVYTTIYVICNIRSILITMLSLSLSLSLCVCIYISRY